MTTELILLFLYIGYMALHSAIDDSRRSDRASALLATVGLVLIPIIYWSVNCPDPNQCAALHQQSSMSDIEPNIRFAWLVTAVGFWMFAFAVILMRVRNIILQREQHTRWVKQLDEVQR
jgi:heme exporter protein C